MVLIDEGFEETGRLFIWDMCLCYHIMFFNNKRDSVLFYFNNFHEIPHKYSHPDVPPDQLLTVEWLHRH